MRDDLVIVAEEELQKSVIQWQKRLQNREPEGQK